MNAAPLDFKTLERARLTVVLATIALNLAGVIAFSFAPWSDWRTGALLNALDNLLLIVHTIRRRDRLMAHLLLFGIVVGFTELAADAWLVDATRTLDYSLGGGPMLWRSPLWMPIAWQIVAVQFGYIGLRLFERFRGLGLLLTGLLGAVNIPFYEEMALRTNWWKYVDCRMFLHTPYYIIVGEFFIAASLGGLARFLRREKGSMTMTAGAAGGAAIFVFYALAYWLCERTF